MDMSSASAHTERAEAAVTVNSLSRLAIVIRAGCNNSRGIRAACTTHDGFIESHCSMFMSEQYALVSDRHPGDFFQLLLAGGRHPSIPTAISGDEVLSVSRRSPASALGPDPWYAHTNVNTAGSSWAGHTVWSDDDRCSIRVARELPAVNLSKSAASQSVASH